MLMLCPWTLKGGQLVGYGALPRRRLSSFGHQFPRIAIRLISWRLVRKMADQSGLGGPVVLGPAPYPPHVCRMLGFRKVTCLHRVSAFFSSFPLLQSTQHRPSSPPAIFFRSILMPSKPNRSIDPQGTTCRICLLRARLVLS
jgi:hypothetical protein